ncbi:hypothetical protein PGTUg99_037475 [Puccinia graminis f. sp. tritici]|uniref:Uncharacterized protein n=1 Tax=Puccinia graminis f. sp. tritici TaxID=56615 RepID=A0A5B0RNJ9_PUCGR|nr:hypothetical protein PGTUg99_037475 [Puccinia graminis f. sp. tritici]
MNFRRLVNLSINSVVVRTSDLYPCYSSTPIEGILETLLKEYPKLIFQLDRGRNKIASTKRHNQHGMPIPSHLCIPIDHNIDGSMDSTSFGVRICGKAQPNGSLKIMHNAQLNSAL